MALHILVDHQNVADWRLVLNYMRTPPTHYYLKSSGQAATWILTLSGLSIVTFLNMTPII